MSEVTLSILFEKRPLDSTNDDKKPCVQYGTHPTTPNFLKHPTTEELTNLITQKPNQNKNHGQDDDRDRNVKMTVAKSCVIFL